LDKVGGLCLQSSAESEQEVEARKLAILRRPLHKAIAPAFGGCRRAAQEKPAAPRRAMARELDPDDVTTRDLDSDAHRVLAMRAALTEPAPRQLADAELTHAVLLARFKEFLDRQDRSAPRHWGPRDCARVAAPPPPLLCLTYQPIVELRAPGLLQRLRAEPFARAAEWHRTRAARVREDRPPELAQGLPSSRGLVLRERWDGPAWRLHRGEAGLYYPILIVPPPREDPRFQPWEHPQILYVPVKPHHDPTADLHDPPPERTADLHDPRRFPRYLFQVKGFNGYMARHRWRLVHAHARFIGKLAIVLLPILEHVRFRPGGSGADQARASFASLAALENADRLTVAITARTHTPARPTVGAPREERRDGASPRRQSN
jgi:hypothetical protein